MPRGILENSRLGVWLWSLHSVFHLDALDLGATHAAAAVHQEQQLSSSPVRFQRFTEQVGTEVEHQNRAAENVLVVPLPHKLHLQSADDNRYTNEGNKREKFAEVPTFFSGSESFLVQRMKSLREQICSSYWLNESLPLSRMTSGL